MLNLIFIVSPIISPCQRIPVKLVIINRKLLDHLPISNRINQCVFIQLLQHLHYVRFSINLHISWKHLKNIRIQKFQLCCLFLFSQRFHRYAILTRLCLIPEWIALTHLHCICIRTVFCSLLQHLTINQTYNWEHFSQALHLLFCLLHCHTVLLIRHRTPHSFCPFLLLFSPNILSIF